MKKFTKEVVDNLADILLIGLTEEENKMVLDEFTTIDQDIDRLNAIEGLEKVEPMTHCLDDFICELRDDEVEESIPIEDLLKNCDNYVDTEIKVSKIVG